MHATTEPHWGILMRKFRRRRSPHNLDRAENLPTCTGRATAQPTGKSYHWLMTIEKTGLPQYYDASSMALWVEYLDLSAEEREELAEALVRSLLPESLRQELTSSWDSSGGEE